jgi:hypothetical protein
VKLRVAWLIALVGVSAVGARAEATTPTDDSDGDGVPDATDAYPDDARYTVPLTVAVRCDLPSPVDDPDRWEMTFVIDRVLLDFSEPWAATFPAEGIVECETVDDDGFEVNIDEPATDIEQADVEASPGFASDTTIGSSYEMCVEHGTSWTTERFPMSEMQVSDVEDMLAYCPNHPDRAAIEVRVEALGGEQAEPDQDIRFGDGLYRVGEDIPPGHYVTESETGFAGCYWERQDEIGETIDNFFGRVFRTEVTIAPTDYAFLTEGCEEWERTE